MGVPVPPASTCVDCGDVTSLLLLLFLICRMGLIGISTSKIYGED